MRRLSHIAIILLCIILAVFCASDNIFALRPLASKNYNIGQALKDLEHSLNRIVIQQGQNNILAIEEEKDPRVKARLLAGHINTNVQIKKALLMRKAQLRDVFMNVEYRLDFKNGPKIAISPKDGKIASVASWKVYKFIDMEKLTARHVNYNEFLNMKLLNPSGDIISVEDYFKREGVWGSVKSGFPAEIAGAIYFDEAKNELFELEPFSLETGNVIAIDFDERGYRIRSSVANSKPIMLQNQSPLLDFHFHPDEDILPSPRDMLMMVGNKSPMLILSPTGKGKVWIVADERELVIRLKPYIDKVDIHARKFSEKAIKEGWIVGAEIDLLIDSNKISPVFINNGRHAGRIDSAA